MIKKIKRTDYMFIISLVAVFFFHLCCILIVNVPRDETFYITIPLRLINGDSLVQHEWHLSQFSSFFSYLPVYFWMKVNHSADGILLFMRFMYFVIHTITAVVIYLFFRRYKLVSIAASMIFYIQFAYRLCAISYNSMFAIFILLLTFCLLKIYETQATKFYIGAGICFGCCCINNPLFCFFIVLYLAFCIIWKHREKSAEAFFTLSEATRRSIKPKRSPGAKKVSQQHGLSKIKQEKINIFLQNTESYGCLFSKKAVCYSIAGILSVAIIAVIFFFLTGGTFKSLLQNLSNMIASSEYLLVSSSFFHKLKETYTAIKNISFNIPVLLPLFFLFLYSDKKRKAYTHKIFYLCVSALLAVVYAAGIIFKGDYNVYIFSLPFAIFSLVCYILTERKNKPLFYCMWCICLIGAIFSYSASNTQLSSVGVVLSINNIAGAIFTIDLFKEMLPKSKKSIHSKTKNPLRLGHYVICVVFFLHAALYLYIMSYGQIPDKNDIQITSGPFAGMLTDKDNYESYTNYINDLNEIKKQSKENDPVLLITFKNWLYLYIDRPYSAYTTWEANNVSPELLATYYEQNPDRVPKYIYVDSDDTHTIEYIDQLFEYNKKQLSTGILLTINEYKPYKQPEQQ